MLKIKVSQLRETLKQIVLEKSLAIFLKYSEVTPYDLINRYRSLKAYNKELQSIVAKRSSQSHVLSYENHKLAGKVRAQAKVIARQMEMIRILKKENKHEQESSPANPGD